ncbi:hypothetical protein UCREL1_8525 [Eutypa lata UCREL1]|uniref:DUF7726 domain-containing protein n=1 Tax=Eutypa lata (strain UCR-EL1) TaxID=1287681 RepID=M7SE49_EUTLA|nr:hypothetical protein UCREL1_8525 [Eutypa lata UCREL1]
MPPTNATSQRKALGDASNRANLTAQGEAGDALQEKYLDIIKTYDAIGRPGALKSAQTKENEVHSATSKGKATAAKPSGSSSRKRKAETTLEEDIAAYKQDLGDKYAYLWDEPVTTTCNQVRGKINKLLDSGIMKKVEFCKAIGLSNNNLNAFLSKTGPYGGSGCAAYHAAWRWFKERELERLKMPDVKKRQKLEAEQASVATSGTSAGAASKPSLTSIPDISNIHLLGEETDEVEVYDTCDEIRRKINAHLKTPGLTQAQFCRDIYGQLHVPKCKSIQSKQLSDFRGQKGPRTGAKSTVFYAAYVYFEKLRLAEGKPENKHRQEMKAVWEHRGGMDRDVDHRTS